MVTIILDWLSCLFFRRKESIYSRRGLQKIVASLKRKERRIFFNIERTEKIKRKILGRFCARDTSAEQRLKASYDLRLITRRIVELQREWTTNYENRTMVENFLKAAECNSSIDKQPTALKGTGAFFESGHVVHGLTQRSKDDNVALIDGNATEKYVAESLTALQILEQELDEMELALQDNLPYSKQVTANTGQATENTFCEKT